MPFDDRFRPVLAVIRKVVEGGNRGRAIRADDIFRPGNIVEQLKKAIQQADFCIADVTDNNPNVMWEVGYASALKKPVIAIRQHNEDIPIDVRQERFFNYEMEKPADLQRALRQAVESVIADLSSNPPFLGWYYDELTVLQHRLSRCYPSTKGRDLLTILKEAITRSDNFRWTFGDEERLMTSIVSKTGRFERTDSFWWLIVHGVFVYNQIDHFQIRGSEGYRENLHLVTFSERGLALLNVLSEDVRPQTQPVKANRGRTKTSEEEFFRELIAHSPEEAKVARRILDWSHKHFDYVKWQGSSFVPVHEYGGKFSHNPITVFGVKKVPRVQIKFGRMKRRNEFSDQTRIEVFNRLNAIPGVNISKRDIDKYPTIPLSVLTKDKNLNNFLRTIEWTMTSIQKSPRN